MYIIENDGLHKSTVENERKMYITLFTIVRYLQKDGTEHSRNFAVIINHFVSLTNWFFMNKVRSAKLYRSAKQCSPHKIHSKEIRNIKLLQHILWEFVITDISYLN